MINNSHYSKHDVQAVDLIDIWQLSPELFSALKYIERAGTKPDNSYDQDVLKAIWYLTFSLLKNKEKSTAITDLITQMIIH